jgi:tRNA dimethylallyltransferase
MKDKNLIVIVGPTAIGKTGIAIELAQQLNTEIISSDSRQIYRELKIGTARPSDEQLSMAKHYFIASHSINEYYNASMFEIAALNVINEIFNTNNNAIMVGGSGLYVNAVCHGIDDLPTIEPEVRNNLTKRLNNEGIESLRTELLRIDPEYCKTADIQNPKRILKALEIYYMTGMPYSMLLTKTKKERNFNIIKIGLNIERQLLYDQINKRVDSMIANGLIKEAEHLLPFKNLNALNTVGYKELFSYFNNEISLTKATELIKQNTRNYAKRQLTWFSRDTEIEWFNPVDKIEILNFIINKTQ